MFDRGSGGTGGSASTTGGSTASAGLSGFSVAVRGFGSGMGTVSGGVLSCGDASRAGGMGGPWIGPAGLCEGCLSSDVARGFGSGMGAASAFSGSVAPASSGTLSAGTAGLAGVGCGIGGPCTGPAGSAAGAAAGGLSLGTGMTPDDCGSFSSSTGGSLSGFAEGTGAMRGVAIFFAGRGLRCFGALCCCKENSFSSQFFAANESVGGRRKIPKIVMAKASREIDSLPMVVNDFDHEWLHG